MATFVGKMGAARCDARNCTRKLIFAKDYHHSRAFSRKLETVDNSRNFSFAYYSRYTVCHLEFQFLKISLAENIK